MTLNRRQMLLAAGAAAFGPATLSRIAAAADQGSPKKILFYTKSSGFQHSVITRKDGQHGLAERILTEIGKAHGFEVVASKDGTLFEPDKIGEWDGFAFMTTGDLTTEGTNDGGKPMSKEGKKAFLDAIEGGKGFIGMHCATDTFHSQGDQLDPYIKMIGAEFIVHGAQQEAKIDVVDSEFPGARPFGCSSFTLNDEWYALKNFADDLHVILAYDTKDMKGDMYQRPNFPMTWARKHGKGRVFYTAMGHREDVWENEKYQGLLVGALGWSTGKVDANVEPNVRKATPDYQKLKA